MKNSRQEIKNKTIKIINPKAGYSNILIIYWSFKN